MPRRTISIPEAVERMVRGAQGEDESFSAAVARLVEAGARATQQKRAPAWVGAGEGPRDLGRNAERYLRRTVPAR